MGGGITAMEKTEKGYCFRCDNEVDADVQEELQENTIKGFTFKALVNNAYCINCGGEVYIPAINDHNLDLISDSYRKQTGRITINEIEQILTKYNIGAKPFSLLLEWGEITVLRYLKGQIPEKEHSDRLKLILNDANVFRDLYERNKECLTPLARKKIESSDSYKSQYFAFGENNLQIACLESYFTKEPSILNGFTVFNIEKLVNVILYFAILHGVMYKTKLNKLLWYCDMLHFKRTSHSITGLTYMHHYFGPTPIKHDWIYGSLCDAFIELDENEYGAIIKPLKEFNTSAFSQSELDVLKTVGNKFGSWFSSELKDYSHKEEGYAQTTQGDFIPFSYASSLSIS